MARRPETPAQAALAAADSVRIDKWLWTARFYKTRSLAAAAVEAGQVRVNGERAKSARLLRPGERITVRKAGSQWDVEVIGVGTRRGSASEAAQLYRESEASRAAREEEAARRRAAAATHPSLDGRPTKRDRRKLEDFLNEP
jgi:ribosome-associated heat shock protein Hsp15